MSNPSRSAPVIALAVVALAAVSPARAQDAQDDGLAQINRYSSCVYRVSAALISVGRTVEAAFETAVDVCASERAVASEAFADDFRDRAAADGETLSEANLEISVSTAMRMNDTRLYMLLEDDAPQILARSNGGHR